MKACDFIWKHLADQAKVRPPHVFMTWHAIKERGKEFNPAAFAAFTGLEEKHVIAIMAVLERNAIPFKEVRESVKRGTRLKDDFTLPEDWRDFAAGSRHWDDATIDRVAEDFKDYWTAKAGKDANKLDWKATWRKWVRGSHYPDGTAPSLHKTDWPAYCVEMAAKMRRIGRDDDAAEWERKAGRSGNAAQVGTIALRLVG